MTGRLLFISWVCCTATNFAWQAVFDRDWEEAAKRCFWQGSAFLIVGLA